MPTFVRFNHEGKILGVWRAAVAPKGEDPVIETSDDLFVVEIEEDEGTKNLAPHEFFDVFSVDPLARKLVGR